MYFEMHKHSQYSMFDGFDKIKNIVSYAKQLGHKAIGLTDHGNASGIAQLYLECQKQEIKPLMGCEMYFQPVFDKEKKTFHLCMFAYNEEGYRNLCQLISEANEKNFYKKGIVTFELLEKYSKGLICSTACIAGFVPQAVNEGNKKLAKRAALRFKDIFGDNFYFEVQPMKIDDEGTQEKVNMRMLSLGEELGIKTVLTTDSHFTEKEDFDSYLMMHKMSKIGTEKGEGFTIEHIEETYRERYMYSETEISEKFLDMHSNTKYSVSNASRALKRMLQNMEDIYEQIDVKLDFADSIPSCDDFEDTYQVMKDVCIARLKETDRYNKQYIERLKYELKVIKDQDLCDYFMIVRDYVVWAKEHDIYVGPGRGSVGGSLAAELMGITEIDAIEVGTDFERFLRADKKKMPDIDLDFENERQEEVMQYIIEKYKGRATKIMTFGYYKSANLINDLCKVYDISKSEIPRIKAIIKSRVPDLAHFEFEDIEYKELIKDPSVREIDRTYPKFVKHFCKLCGQVKYYGKHPAGVLVTKMNISRYVPMSFIKGSLICSYDKYDIEALDMLKFDVLALKTMNVIHEIERMTEDKFDRRHIDSKTKDEMYRRFSTGETLGIFQLNKKAAQEILSEIQADNIQDVIAAISCNRPGTLKLGMHKVYAASKQNLDKNTPWYKYTSDAYGAIIYQEHVMKICNGLAHMDAGSTDKLMKFKFSEEERGGLKKKFVKGAIEFGNMKRSDAEELFDNMALYMFNKGHGAGYALISEWQMYHKVKHPIEFWFSTLKWEQDDFKKFEFMSEAAYDGNVIMLPHVNFSADYSIRYIEGDAVIQMGYNIVKNVGDKAAFAIQADRKERGPFKSYDDFCERCKSGAVNSRVISSLLEEGALDFDKKMYLKRVKQYNAALYMKGERENAKNK